MRRDKDSKLEFCSQKNRSQVIRHTRMKDKAETMITSSCHRALVIFGKLFSLSDLLPQLFFSGGVDSKLIVKV